jgi:hypothetical protein
MPEPDAFPEKISIGDKYGPAMTIADQAAADAYFERCVEHTIRYWNKDRSEAEAIERANLGYYAGYYDDETRARVERMFNCAHPVFGRIADVGLPTADQAFAAGLELALARRS